MFINGVLLASAAAVTLGLGVTLLLVILVGGESPALAAETRPLLEAVALFAVMTVASGVSFVGVIKNRSWRWPAVAIMLGFLLVMVAYFWPA